MNLLFIKTSLCLLFVNVINGQNSVPSCLKIDKDDNICESPGYPNSYQRGDCVCEFTVPDGYQITVLIQDMDLDSTEYDYVTITGGSDDKIYKYSWSLSTTTKQPTSFVVNKPNVLINFHAEKDAEATKRGFKILLQQYGELTTTEEVTTENIQPTPAVNDSIYHKIYLDVYPTSFKLKENKFKDFMVNITEQFIKKHAIEVIASVNRDNIKLQYAKQCTVQWPNSKHCSEIMYAIPIALNDSSKYELTADNLEKMWLEFGQKYLENYTNWKEYQPPDNHYNTILWLSLSLIVLFAFLMFLFFLKMFSFRINGQFKRRPSDTDQIMANSNRNSDASLWPMQSQIVPPLFENESSPYVYYEPDPVQRNSVINSQIPSSHTNTMMSIDDMSDDEILTVPNRSGNNPNQKPIIKFDTDADKESAL